MGERGYFENENNNLDKSNNSSELLEKSRWLKSLIETVPKLLGNITDLQALERHGPDTVFRLAERPKAQELQNLLKFRHGGSEVGIICANKQWLLVIGYDEKVGLTGPWKEFHHENLFQIDMHTHPGQEEYKDPPSLGDLAFLNTSIDGKLYIISQKVITEFSAPHIDSKTIGGYAEGFRLAVRRGLTHFCR